MFLSLSSSTRPSASSSCARSAASADSASFGASASSAGAPFARAAPGPSRGSGSVPAASGSAVWMVAWKGKSLVMSTPLRTAGSRERKRSAASSPSAANMTMPKADASVLSVAPANSTTPRRAMRRTYS